MIFITIVMQRMCCGGKILLCTSFTDFWRAWCVPQSCSDV